MVLGVLVISRTRSAHFLRRFSRHRCREEVGERGEDGVLPNRRGQRRERRQSRVICRQQSHCRRSRRNLRKFPPSRCLRSWLRHRRERASRDSRRPSCSCRFPSSERDSCVHCRTGIQLPTRRRDGDKHHGGRKHTSGRILGGSRS